MIKSTISDIIIVLDKPVMEKKFNLLVWFAAFSLYIRFNFSSVNERFGIFTENKHSIF